MSEQKTFKPIVGTNIFKEVQKMKDRILDEQRRYEAMTPEQQAEYDRVQQMQNEEVEKLLKKLRGPGFTEIKIGGKSHD